MKLTKCADCGGTGLIPFKNKEGKVIPHTFVYCECYDENPPEYYHRVRPGDFDFPISYDVYRSLCQEHGWPDPGSCESSPTQPEIKPILRPRPVDKEFDQLKGQLIHIDNKLNEHLKRAKPQGEY